MIWFDFKIIDLIDFLCGFFFFFLVKNVYNQLYIIDWLGKYSKFTFAKHTHTHTQNLNWRFFFFTIILTIFIDETHTPSRYLNSNFSCVFFLSFIFINSFLFHHYHPLLKSSWTHTHTHHTLSTTHPTFDFRKKNSFWKNKNTKMEAKRFDSWFEKNGPRLFYLFFCLSTHFFFVLFISIPLFLIFFSPSSVRSCVWFEFFFLFLN